MQVKDHKITLRAFLLGVVFCAVFAALTIYFSNRRNIYITSTQIPTLPFLLLFATVLLINPVCRLIRIVRPFSPAEVLIVFLMGVVSSGISTYGLSAQLVPFAGSLYNRAWHNERTKWNLYVEPFLEEDFFVGEKGIREAAGQYRASVIELARLQSIYAAAAALTNSQVMVAVKERAVENILAGEATDARKTVALSRARSDVDNARVAHTDSESRWRMVSEGQDFEGGPADAVRAYGPRISELEVNVADNRAALAAIEEKAFEKVEIFRRGLPKEMRAFPGILPLANDTVSTYGARLKRFSQGRKTVKFLLAARDAAGSGDTTEVREDLAEAISMLRPVADPTAFEQEKKRLDDAASELKERLVALGGTRADRYEERRMASRSRMRELDKEIDNLGREKKRITSDQLDTRIKLETIAAEIETIERVQVAVDDMESLSERVATLPGHETVTVLNELVKDCEVFDAGAKRFFLGDVPWSHWAKPLFNWGILIGLTYLMLMTFNVLIFRQWAHNEKLIYPLAELPEFLAGAHDKEPGVVPSVFRSGLFWAGAIVPVVFLGWNMLCQMELIPGGKPLNLVHYWSDYIANSKLAGLRPNARSEIFFTMVGLAFLVPKKISFSLWFFAIVFMAELLVLVWMGYGVDMNSFKAGWFHIMNFRTAQGGGALLVFSSVMLFKCRKYILCCFSHKSVVDLERDERLELRVSSFLFLVASVGTILVLWLGMGANLWHTVFAFMIILLITIGMVRAVTEGGILGFQCWATPFHFMKTVVGMNKPWTSSGLFAPIMVYYGILFLDLKTFIAPAMGNALKMRSDLRMERRRFYAGVAAAIAVATVVAVGGAIMMSYAKGADLMNSWFYTSLPQGWGFGKIAVLAKDAPAASPGLTKWIAAGAVAMSLLLYFRGKCFWLPHPLGLVMLVNPLMHAYWFSIFVGWLVKTIVTKYGSKDLYAKTRCIFLGLMFGELAMCALSMIVSWATGEVIRIDLNRNM